MGKVFCFLAIMALAFACIGAQVPAPQPDADHYNFLVTLNSLRVKMELKNAELEIDTARVILGNRIRAARNIISVHISEAKLQLKDSKNFLKPNGMNIAECVSNATTALSQLPVDEINACLSNGIAAIQQKAMQLKMLALQAEHIILYCQINELELATCVPEKIQEITARIETVKEDIRALVDNLGTDTCVGDALKDIFEQMGEILATEFSNCVYNELVEA